MLVQGKEMGYYEILLRSLSFFFPETLLHKSLKSIIRSSVDLYIYEIFHHSYIVEIIK